MTDDSGSSRRNCPNCGGLIEPEATRCPHCGYTFKPIGSASSDSPPSSRPPDIWLLPPELPRENPYEAPRTPLPDEPLTGVLGILLILVKVLATFVLAYLFFMAVVIAGLVTCAAVAIPSSNLAFGIIAGLVGGAFFLYLAIRLGKRILSWLWRGSNTH